MNPWIPDLQPYPFERQRTLFSQTTPANKPHINMGIGEPKHTIPPFILQTLDQNPQGYGSYPPIKGIPELRQAIANWIQTRYQTTINPETQIAPACGTREALFAFIQSVLDPRDPNNIILCPNPFYQIYEGAALLAGAQTAFYNLTKENNYKGNFQQIPPRTLAQTKILFLCTPNNPTGACLNLEDYKTIFALQDQYNFIIASDEPYSEIYFTSDPPIGLLQAATHLGCDHSNLILFNSLSKRSNIPGLRSGFVAGDPNIIAPYLQYRTYHGVGMPVPTQVASVAAWKDESHVQENLTKYRQKFKTLTPQLQPHLNVQIPDASFFLWAHIPNDLQQTLKQKHPSLTSDEALALELHRQQNVTALPGTYLARSTPEGNPGTNQIRLALVSEPEECQEAINRIIQTITNLS